jgi:hypothetical protein
MTKFLLLYRGPAPRPAPDLAGELLDAQHLADPGLAVLIGAPAGPVTGYWLVDVESLDRAVQIAVAAGGPVEVRELMRSSAPDELP